MFKEKQCCVDINKGEHCSQVESYFFNATPTSLLIVLYPRMRYIYTHCLFLHTIKQSHQKRARLMYASAIHIQILVCTK